MFRRKKDDTVDLKGSGEPTPVATDQIRDTDSGAGGAARAFIRPNRGNHAPTVAPATARPEMPHRRPMVDLPGPGPRRHDRGSDSAVDGKKLIVGRDIELAGEITACDRLVVEGKVTADLTDAGAIEVAQTGVFRGSADVDEADISGLFDGNLTARRKLTIRATGRVRGTVRYTRLSIEMGGEIHGTIEVLPVTMPSGDTVPQLTGPVREDAYSMPEPS